MSKRSADTDEFADIREQVAALCAKFPGEYWRALDRERAYPTDFVTALTKAGYLAADPGGIRRQRAGHQRGRRDPRGSARVRRQRRRLPRADVYDGHDPAAWQRRAEEELSAEDRQR